MSIHKLLLALFLALPFSLAAHADSGDRVIVVNGEGSASVAPDMALLSLTVMREAATAREALSANSTAMAQVVAAMKKQGVAERDLRTQGLSIAPRYTYGQRNNPGDTRKLIGYTVRNSLSVRVRDLERVGDLLDESVSLGVNEGGSITFLNDDPSAAMTAARIAAVQDARQKARTLSDAAGVELGDVMHISEQSRGYRPEPRRTGMLAMEAASDSVPVEAGENTYDISVQMTFAIAD